MKQILCALLLSLCLPLFGGTGKRHTYRVETIGGVPMITEDGKPVRARMLYVSPPDFKIFPPQPEYPFAEREEKQFELVFAPKDDIEKPLFVPNPVPRDAEFEISSLEISAADGGKTEAAVRDGKNGKIFECPPLRGGEKYTFKMRANSTAENGVLLRAYLAGGKDRKAVKPEPKIYVAEQVRLARGANVDFITFPVQAEDFFGEKPNYEFLERNLKTIVSANPDARIIVRVRCYPPKKWFDENPDDVLTFSDGKKSDAFPSISSEKYRAQSRRALGLIIDYAEKHYGGNIAGYHPAGGNSCEWFYGQSHKKLPFSGYDKATARAWNRWLLRNYPSDAALQKAWNDKSASRETAAVPTQAERESPVCLINPETQMRLADFFKFWQDEMVDIVLQLADVVRSKVPDKLSVAFYGYTPGFAGCYNGAANTGHYAFGKLLRSDKIDIYCGPNSYKDRFFGDGQMANTVPETIARRGRLWIEEDDLRTYLAVRQAGEKPCGIRGDKSSAETESVLFRSMAHEAVRNNGCWWMDLTGRGWFADKRLWDISKRFEKAELDMLENPSPYKCEVAFVFGEESANFLAPKWEGGYMASEFTRALYNNANRESIGYGTFLLRDFLEKPTDTKLDVYSVAYALTAKERKAIFGRSRKTPSIFFWAAGYVDLDGRKFSLEAVEETTGFKVENVQDGGQNPHYIATAIGEKLGLAKDTFLHARKHKFAIMLSPIPQAGDRVLAVYENGKPAVVLRGKNVFCGLGFSPNGLYKAMYKIASVHEYADIPCSVRDNGKYLSVVPVDIPNGETRNITITPKYGKSIFDAISGEKLADGQYKTTAKRGDTFFLCVE